MFSGWAVYAPPRTPIPSPIDSAHRVTSIPVVSAHQQTLTPPNLSSVTERDMERSGRPAGPAGHFSLESTVRAPCGRNKGIIESLYKDLRRLTCQHVYRQKCGRTPVHTHVPLCVLVLFVIDIEDGLIQTKTYRPDKTGKSEHGLLTFSI